MSYFIDVYTGSFNKAGEELCGDKASFHRTDDGVIAVLSDGLGSGVKANILATLTSKIAITMLKHGAEIEEVVDTITNTLPVCNVRKLAYSTFSILKIKNNGEGYLAEFDTPSMFFMRKGKLQKYISETREINGKNVREMRFKMEKDDSIVIVSDGAIHAGAGQTLNLGWQWENVAKYLEDNIGTEKDSKYTATMLLGACNDLYLEKPGDDTTVLALKLTLPKYMCIFAGPPEDRKYDAEIVKELLKREQVKVICGGTAANIVARETGKKIETTFDIFDPRVPPTAVIEGIDLVTEGVLTLNVALEKLKVCKEENKTIPDTQKDGASELCRLLLNGATHIKIVAGRAINPAHQNPYFPKELSIKMNILYELKKILEEYGKVVGIEHL